MGEFLYIYASGHLLSLAVPHLPGRRPILAAAIAYALIYALYMALNGAYAGCAANIIAAACALISFSTPDHKMQETLHMRMMAVIALCLGCTVLIYAEPLDVLPILSMFLARASETLSHPQKVRIGYLISGFAWLGYIAVTGLYVMFFETLRWLSVLWAKMKHARTVTPSPLLQRA